MTIWERRLSGHTGTFQIHAYKLFEELAHFLRKENLAWEPDVRVSDGPDYLEMHPHLGEAVMARLRRRAPKMNGLRWSPSFRNFITS